MEIRRSARNHDKQDNSNIPLRTSARIHDKIENSIDESAKNCDENAKTSNCNDKENVNPNAW